MLFVALCLYIVYVLTIKKTNKQLSLFCLTLLVSIFFFSSKDPIVGMPLYFEAMLISIAYSFFSRANREKNNFALFFGVFTIGVMLVQMINLKMGINVTESLLLNKSNTDTLEIKKELFVPILNFTVFKHFVFAFLYIVFILANINLLQEKETYKYLGDYILKIFKILFVGIIIESLIVNLSNGYNDRAIIGIIFNTDSNMIYPYESLKGLYACCLWLCEPSEISIVFIFYAILFTSGSYKGTDLFWIIISCLAVFLTFSTSGLIISALFSTLIFFDSFFFKKTDSVCFKGFFLVFFFLAAYIVLTNSSALFDKLNSFLSGDRSWGSGTFRSQSIKLGLEVFKFSPLIGLGIGTNYSHSGLVQTLANIGILGTGGLILFQLSSLPKFRLDARIFIKAIIFLIITIGTGMVQVATSPAFLAYFIAISPFFDVDALQSEEDELIAYLISNDVV